MQYGSIKYNMNNIVTDAKVIGRTLLPVDYEFIDHLTTTGNTTTNQTLSEVSACRFIPSSSIESSLFESSFLSDTNSSNNNNNDDDPTKLYYNIELVGDSGIIFHARIGIPNIISSSNTNNNNNDDEDLEDDDEDEDEEKMIESLDVQIYGSTSLTMMGHENESVDAEGCEFIQVNNHNKEDNDEDDNDNGKEEEEEEEYVFLISSEGPVLSILPYNRTTGISMLSTSSSLYYPKSYEVPDLIMNHFKPNKGFEAITAYNININHNNNVITSQTTTTTYLLATTERCIIGDEEGHHRIIAWNANVGGRYIAEVEYISSIWKKNTTTDAADADGPKDNEDNNNQDTYLSISDFATLDYYKQQQQSEEESVSGSASSASASSSSSMLFVLERAYDGITNMIRLYHVLLATENSFPGYAPQKQLILDWTESTLKTIKESSKSISTTDDDDDDDDDDENNSNNNNNKNNNTTDENGSNLYYYHVYDDIPVDNYEAICFVPNTTILLLINDDNANPNQIGTQFIAIHLSIDTRTITTTNTIEEGNNEPYYDNDNNNSYIHHHPYRRATGGFIVLLVLLLLLITIVLLLLWKKRRRIAKRRSGYQIPFDDEQHPQQKKQQHQEPTLPTSTTTKEDDNDNENDTTTTINPSTTAATATASESSLQENSISSVIC